MTRMAVRTNINMNRGIVISLLVSICVLRALGQDSSQTLNVIKGKVDVKKALQENNGYEDWLKRTHIYVDGGRYIGVPNQKGEFSISGVPSGSYVVEVAHPTFAFPRYRVDITTKGKIRARVLNNVDTTKVELVKYPINFQAVGKIPYFEKREEWRITDVLKNPMVLMLVLPMVMMFIMPKMMNAADEETKKEMESQMSMLRSPNQNMPDISETLTSWLGGSSSQAKSKKRASQR